MKSLRTVAYIVNSQHHANNTNTSQCPHLVASLIVARVQAHRLVQILRLARGIHAEFRLQITKLPSCKRKRPLSGYMYKERL